MRTSLSRLIRRLSLLVAVLLPLGFLAPPAHADGPTTYTVQVVNKSGVPNSQVYLLLHGGSSSDGELVNDTPTTFDKLAGSGTTGSFSMLISNTSTMRLFVSYGAAVAADEPADSLTRYDKIEWTYSGFADATSVDFIGIPWKLESFDAAGTLRGTSGYTAGLSTIISDVQAIKGATNLVYRNPHPPSGLSTFVRIPSPTNLGYGDRQAAYPDFGPYVKSMFGKSLRIKDMFFAPSGQDPQLMDYSGTVASDGTVNLTGKLCPYVWPARVCKDTKEWTAGPDFMIKGSDYSASDAAVYGANVPYYTRDPGAKTWVAHTVSEVIPAANLERNYMSAFALGWWNGDPGNGLPTNTINFDIYAKAHFGDAFPTKAFAQAQPGNPAYSAFNQYASIVYQSGNAYGFPFTDLLPAGHSPLIPAQYPGGTLKLTIPSDTAASTARSAASSAHTGTLARHPARPQQVQVVGDHPLVVGVDSNGREYRSVVAFPASGMPKHRRGLSAKVELRHWGRSGPAACRTVEAAVEIGHLGARKRLESVDFWHRADAVVAARPGKAGTCAVRLPRALARQAVHKPVQVRLVSTHPQRLARFVGGSGAESKRPGLILRYR